MERVKSWDWSTIVLALCIGAMGVKLLFDPKPGINSSAAEPELTRPRAASVTMTPRLLSLLSDADR